MDGERFTLIDVMRGVYKHGLACKLSEESFTFLIGLILEHNDKGFKMPFDLNNQQAMAAGGGNTPKSVRRRRLTLSKFDIDGEPLLEFTSGNFGRNTCATYEINYKKLFLYNGVWTGKTDLPAQIWGSSGDSRGRVEGTVGGTVPGPILRSEENREEEKQQQNEVVVGENLDEEKPKPTTATDITRLGGAILNRWPHQLTAAPSDHACRQILDEVDHDIDKLLEALDRTPAILERKDNGKITPNYAAGIVLKWAKNPAWGLQEPVSTSNLTQAQQNKIRMRIQDLKAELLKGEAETDLTKFEGVTVEGANGPIIVDTKQEWISAREVEIKRLGGMIGG